MEKDFDAGFEVTFNYGYGCCAFAHNICESEPLIPNGMPDTSKLLPSKFFINPRCPPTVAPGVHTTDPDVDVREAGKSPPAVEARLGSKSDSPVRIIGEDKEPDASSEN